MVYSFPFLFWIFRLLLAFALTSSVMLNILVHASMRLCVLLGARAVGLLPGLGP